MALLAQSVSIRCCHWLICASDPCCQGRGLRVGEVGYQQTYNTAKVLHNNGMNRIDVSTARANLSDVLERAQHEAVLVERYGKPAGVIISPERHEQLLAALEELEDTQAFDEALAEEGDNIPWEQVKADLGWQ